MRVFGREIGDKITNRGCFCHYEKEVVERLSRNLCIEMFLSAANEFPSLLTFSESKFIELQVQGW